MMDHDYGDKRLTEFIYSYRGSDKKKNNDSSTTICVEELKMLLTEYHGKCYWCGIKVQMESGGERYKPTNISLDRKDNANKCHSYENCVISCGLCNVMRQTMSMELFRALVDNLQGKTECVDLRVFEPSILRKNRNCPWNMMYDHNTKTHAFGSRRDAKDIYFSMLKRQDYKCSVTNCEPAILEATMSNQSHFHLSVDRINSTKGGVKTDHGDPENLQCVMSFVNRAKNTLSNLRFSKEWGLRSFNKGQLSFLLPENHDLNHILTEYNERESIATVDDLRRRKEYRSQIWKESTARGAASRLANIPYQIYLRWRRLGYGFRRRVYRNTPETPLDFVRKFVKVERSWIDDLKKVGWFMEEKNKQPTCKSDDREEKRLAEKLCKNMMVRKGTKTGTNYSCEVDEFRKQKFDKFVRQYRPFVLDKDEIWNRGALCFELFVLFNKAMPIKAKNPQLHEWGRKQTQAKPKRKEDYRKILAKYFDCRPNGKKYWRERGSSWPSMPVAIAVFTNEV